MNLSFLMVFLIIFIKNSIYALWGLISHFFLTAFLFFFLGIEFIGVIILIIYIGAIAVLFIFSIMLLDLRTLAHTGKTFYGKYFGLSIFTLVGFLTFFYIFYPTITFLNAIIPYFSLNIFNLLGGSQTAGSLGWVLLQEFSHLFFLSGLILFLSLLGTLSITTIKLDLSE